MLKNKNNELDLFVKGTTHDLKAPLRTITTFLQEIKRRVDIQDEGEIDQLFGYIESAAHRMDILVTDLFNLSTLGEVANAPTEVQISSLIETITTLLKSDIENKNARIRVEADATIVASENALLQVFQNLISNGLKYCSEAIEPEILIACKQLPTSWQITVKDNGIGIAPNHHEKIFDIFQRLHRWEDYEGSGLGLSLCRKVVEQHHGKIWVESDIGEGSRFIFTIKKGLI